MYRSGACRLHPFPTLTKRRCGSAHESGGAVRHTARGHRNAECRLSAGGCRAASSSSGKATIATFVDPPSELIEGCFERPTPLLFVAGECQPPEWWDANATFFSKRGCTVGTMALSGRGGSNIETLSLKALQAGVAAAVERSGNAPPVIVAHSIAGFVCQQYLQSYAAAGLVLLDSYPPNPAALACSHLMMAYKADAGALDHGNIPNSQELARRIKDDPARFEGMLRYFFAGAHRNGSWSHSPTVQDDGGDETRAPPTPRVSGYCSTISTSAIHRSFPAKAFAEMCIGQPSANLRLEREVVDSLVLGSDFLSEYRKNSASGNSRHDARLWLEALEASAEFHGSGRWSIVDSTGCVGGTGKIRKSWQEFVWNWYDARF